MCAISGKAYFINKEIYPKELSKMTQTLNHRGPDDSGIFISKNKRVGLGNNRLAIIDLSEKGHQPMKYGHYTITFNGEIYNFKELRDKLIKTGYKFDSLTDTEVILALYSKYKEKCLSYLRGMFAFAIYDEHMNTLFLARDRIGKKPLKYLIDEEKIIFASELKAILTQNRVKKKIDFDALFLYLNYGYVPSPKTGFSGINKLEPAHYLYVDIKRRNIVKKRYWEPKFKDKLQLSEKEWSQKILDTLEDATRLRMISDVPIGAFLSGGVDSSGVVATMARLSLKPVRTFTIAFKDKSLNEGRYAANIVKKYKTDHHTLFADQQSVEILPQLAKQLEEPFSDASSIVTHMVSQMTRKYVTVALNGDGGDENFAGYPNRYIRLQRDVEYNTWIQRARPVAARLLKKVPRAKNFFDKAKYPIYQRFAMYNKIFDTQEITNQSKGLLRKSADTTDPYKIVGEVFDGFTGHDLKDAGLKFDLMYFLPDQLLAKMDLASMAVSLEARSPFLDHKMIELACKIPFALKVKGKETKYILKKALETIVPKENLYRTKVGFTIPLNKWFKGSLNQYAAKILLNKNSFIQEILDLDYVEQMINDKNQSQDFGPRLWNLMSLELWYQGYFQ